MKNFMKKILVICMIASVSMLTFGCSDKKENNTETLSLEDVNQDLSFQFNVKDKLDATEADDEESKDDPVESQADSAVDSAVESGEEATAATEIVEVTDEAGEPVTDAQGVVETQVVTVPTEESQNTETPTEPGAVHTPDYTICLANWLDMSKAGDYFFEGEFLIIEFKLNEDLPDGYYPVSVYETDIASWEIVTHVPVCIDGGVVVGDAEAAPQASASSDDFTLTVDNVSASAGDTVKVAVDLKNNPGFCGFIIDIQYDAAAMTIVDAYGGSDFDAAISLVQPAE